ncbi:PIN domain-containing protein [Spirulina major]|uniref:PIN domain-containing protein n=1 Tax=Spirulina major TaxID=270636 RepID=UPI000933E86D|nr:PIN domain-containing protein [Spirulina major]
MSSLRFLLDTNILSEPLKPQPSQAVIQKITENQQSIATASVVYHEIYYGMASLPDSRKRRAIAAYLQDEVLAKLPILSYTTEAAQWHAIARAKLRQVGLID